MSKNLQTKSIQFRWKIRFIDLFSKKDARGLDSWLKTKFNDMDTDLKPVFYTSVKEYININGIPDDKLILLNNFVASYESDSSKSAEVITAGETPVYESQ